MDKYIEKLHNRSYTERDLTKSRSTIVFYKKHD